LHQCWQPDFFLSIAETVIMTTIQMTESLGEALSVALQLDTEQEHIAAANVLEDALQPLRGVELDDQLGELFQRCEQELERQQIRYVRLQACLDVWR
jgi:hypothetical protein